MLCDECKKNPANVLMTVSSSAGETATRHLCASCAMKLGMGVSGGNNMANIMNKLTELLQGKKKQEPEIKVCFGCGQSWEDIQRNHGKLGCPACYDTFRQELEPIFTKINGSAAYVGESPESFTLPVLEDAVAQLEQALASAIAKEQFEQAASLRDRIRTLVGEEERP